MKIAVSILVAACLMLQGCVTTAWIDSREYTEPKAFDVAMLPVCMAIDLVTSPIQLIGIITQVAIGS